MKHCLFDLLNMALRYIYRLGVPGDSIPVIPLELFGKKYICVNPSDCHPLSIKQMFETYEWTERYPLLLACDWEWIDKESGEFWCDNPDCTIFVNERKSGGLEVLDVEVHDGAKTMCVSNADYYTS